MRGTPVSLPKSLAKRVAGRVVAEVKQPSPETIAVHFTDGSILTVRRRDDALAVTLDPAEGRRSAPASGPQPTRRQTEYLEFIKKYMHRYGVAPAESDIQTHFMVSAPAVNQMVRTLEGRGYLERSYDWFGKAVPRSIRVTWDG